MRFVCLLFVLGVLLFHTVAAKRASCASLDGYCSVQERCPFGSALRGYCENKRKCCRLIPTTCKALDGECVATVKGGCPSGEELPVRCGFNEICCRIK